MVEVGAHETCYGTTDCSNVTGLLAVFRVGQDKCAGRSMVRVCNFCGAYKRAKSSITPTLLYSASTSSFVGTVSAHVVWREVMATMANTSLHASICFEHILT